MKRLEETHIWTSECHRDENMIGMDTEMISVPGTSEFIDYIRIRFCHEPLVRKGREDQGSDAL